MTVGEMTDPKGEGWKIRGERVSVLDMYHSLWSSKKTHFTF
jgi:hypothetical protein